MVVESTLEVLGSDAAAVRRSSLQTAAARLNADAHSASASVAVPLASDWKPVNLRIVGFVQERAGRRIFGAGWSALRRDQ